MRWNIRVWRFWKSWFPALAPRDRHFFLQGQATWALACWTAIGALQRRGRVETATEAHEVAAVLAAKDPAPAE